MPYPAAGALIWPNLAFFPASREYHRTDTKVTMRDPGTPSPELESTQELVQDTVVNSRRRLDRFDSRHEGALQAYLRQAVLNRIRDEARRFTRRPPPAELTDSYEAEAASPLDIAIGREGVARYEAALQQLRPSDREA